MRHFSSLLLRWQFDVNIRVDVLARVGGKVVEMAPADFRKDDVDNFVAAFVFSVFEVSC